MNKIYKFLALAMMFAIVSSAVFAMPATQVACGPSLKQADRALSHGLHCGYYALWNAESSLNEDLNGSRTDRDLFEACLEDREKFIWQRRVHNNFNPSVDNLESDELDLLVNEFLEPEIASCITVFTSTNQISGLTAGHGLSRELLQRIEKFRNDGLPQAFLINTGADRGVEQRGTNHWIAAILTKLPPALAKDKFGYKLTFHDSGYVPSRPVGKDQKDPEYKKYAASFKRHTEPFTRIAKDINKLFIEQDFALLRARSLLVEPLGAVAIQCEALNQSASNWQYVGRLEDAIIALNKILGNRDQDIRDVLGKIRSGFNMSERGRIGKINPGYLDYLKEDALKQLNAIFMSLNLDEDFSGKLNEPGYAIEPEVIKKLAINKLAVTYQQFVITSQVTEDAFIQVAGESGISQEIIQAGIAQVQNLDLDEIPMDTE